MKNFDAKTQRHKEKQGREKAKTVKSNYINIFLAL